MQIPVKLFLPPILLIWEIDEAPFRLVLISIKKREFRAKSRNSRFVFIKLNFLLDFYRKRNRMKLESF